VKSPLCCHSVISSGIVFAILLLGSCATAPDSAAPKSREPKNLHLKPFKSPEKYEDTRVDFPKIENAQIRIEPITTRRAFYAGEEINFVFRIQNAGEKGVEIPEWRLVESENLRIFYAPETPELQTVGGKEWICEKPEWSHKRSTLALNPGNAVLVTKPIGFIARLDSNRIRPPGKNYLVYAELNLTSIQARSPVMRITVR
jgi:hypothetical protein